MQLQNLMHRQIQSENGTGKGNYTFTWNDASVEIKTNAATNYGSNY